MKLSLAVVMVLTGLFLMATAPGICGEELIQYGGFEKAGPDSIPQGWKINQDRDTKAELGLDDTMPHSGKYAYKIRIAPPGGRIILYPDDSALGKPEPGKTYTLSLWVNAQNLDYNQFFVAPAVRFNFKPTRLRPVPTIDLMAYMAGVNGWKELTLQVKAPENAQEFSFDIMLTKGIVWLDDISLKSEN